MQSLCQVDQHEFEDWQAIQLLDLATNKKRCLAIRQKGRVERHAVQSAIRLGTRCDKSWVALAQIL